MNTFEQMILKGVPEGSFSDSTLPLRNQYAQRDLILKKRIDTVMPELMRETGIRLYVVICSEYNEDPIFRTMIPSLMQGTASRVSCLMFCINEQDEYEAFSFCRPNPALMAYYQQGYDPKEEDQLDAILRKIRQSGHTGTAVNISSRCGLADGLSKHLYDLLSPVKDYLLEDTDLGIRWLESRTEEELRLYPQIYKIAMDIQDRAYSRDVIKPGITTTSDVEWFILQEINRLGLTAWFSPDVDLQRNGLSDTRAVNTVIEEGDLLHTDMGLTYLGLCTDSQRLAYVLREGEQDLPAGLKKGFETGNRFQDIVCENMIEGKSGNELFTASIEQAKSEGIRAMLYTHPIGSHGHGAGPIIGLYDNQNPIPDQGDLKLHEHTCYALELNTAEPVEEWNQQLVYFYLEETIAFWAEQAVFLDPKGRKEIKLI